jgi:NAD(P)H dehydrogenase (quinone)
MPLSGCDEQGGIAMTRQILITGATGKTGATAATTVLDQGHRVRALVHRLDERADRLAKAGAEVVAADMLDVDAVSRAAKGIDAAYFAYPPAPGMVEAAATFLQAAEENGVGAIVNMSQLAARRDAVDLESREHWIIERMLDHFTGTVTHLQPTTFAEWLIEFWNPATGEYRLPLADARDAPIAAEDIGRVAAAILIDPQPHAGKVYTLFGPAEVDYYQITEVMTRVLGRRVSYVPVTPDEFRSALERRGRDPQLIEHQVNVTADVRDGLYSGTNDIVRRLTGAEPLTIEAFVQRNRERFSQGSAQPGGDQSQGAHDGESGVRETIGEFFGLLGEGDLDRAADLFAEDIDWLVPGDERIPWTGGRTRREEVARYFTDLWSAMVPGEIQMSVDKILVDGPDAVALGHVASTAKATGRRFSTPEAFRFTVEDGKITRMHLYEDTHLVAEAVLG